MPQALFPTGAPTVNFFAQEYAVTKGGQRFLINAGSAESSVAPLTVVVNWQEELKQRVPTR